MVLAISVKCNIENEHSPCSLNHACVCFRGADSNGTNICGFQWIVCSQLLPCNVTKICSIPNHNCVYHSQCNNGSFCYPDSMTNERICPQKLGKTAVFDRWLNE